MITLQMEEKIKTVCFKNYFTIEQLDELIRNGLIVFESFDSIRDRFLIFLKQYNNEKLNDENNTELFHSYKSYLLQMKKNDDLDDDCIYDAGTHLRD